MPMQEIIFMQLAGMTPMQVIAASTRNAARVCRREDQIGTLDAGKTADVIVVQGNPLADLNCLKNVCIVIREGKVIRNDTGR
jgi:imidazolonepropionase-like amidohydrolase